MHMNGKLFAILQKTVFNRKQSFHHPKFHIQNSLLVRNRSVYCTGNEVVTYKWF